MYPAVFILDLISIVVFSYFFYFYSLFDISKNFFMILCDLQKILLERHRNIHARGFIEKRKKRDMYFNGSDAACGVIGCRFSVVKQRHHHCKLCGWACSSVCFLLSIPISLLYDF